MSTPHTTGVGSTVPSSGGSAAGASPWRWGGSHEHEVRHAHPHPLLCIGSSACLPECGQRYESSCHCPCLKRLLFICHFVACRFSFSFLKHRVNGLPEARREDPGPPRCPEGGAHLCFSGSSLLVHACDSAGPSAQVSAAHIPGWEGADGGPVTPSRPGQRAAPGKWG